MAILRLVVHETSAVEVIEYAERAKKFEATGHRHMAETASRLSTAAWQDREKLLKKMNRLRAGISGIDQGGMRHAVSYKL